ncbi:MAG: ATP-binding cassette domain-containing protein [Candidatus Korobacteraceae bacterium]|jgi:putative ABC transport system ATP-binding protein
MIIRTEHLGREVEGKRIVDDINLEVAEGEVVAIVGPSGSGKSSLLRLLNRLDEPTSGTVYFAGQDYRTLAPAELRRRMGMVMQTAFLFPGTVAENVRFGPAQRDEPLSEQAVGDLLAQVGLDGFSNREIHNLSGGEAQRVALARALANSPAVLLLDEPTSALDEDSKLGIENLISAVVASRRLTCVIVTHDLQQAGRMAARVALLSSGRLVRTGLTREVLGAERQP